MSLFRVQIFLQKRLSSGSNLSDNRKVRLRCPRQIVPRGAQSALFCSTRPSSLGVAEPSLTHNGQVICKCYFHLKTFSIWYQCVCTHTKFNLVLIETLLDTNFTDWWTDHEIYSRPYPDRMKIQYPGDASCTYSNALLLASRCTLEPFRTLIVAAPCNQRSNILILVYMAVAAIRPWCVLSTPITATSALSVSILKEQAHIEALPPYNLR